MWQNENNPNGVAANSSRHQTNGFGHNRVAVGFHLGTHTQGSSFLATLGWRTQSLWDCSWPGSRVHAMPPNSFSTFAFSAPSIMMSDGQGRLNAFARQLLRRVDA